jgi:hypothetical protein
MLTWRGLELDGREYDVEEDVEEPDGKFIRTVLDDGVEHRYYINSARAASDEK